MPRPFAVCSNVDPLLYCHLLESFCIEARTLESFQATIVDARANTSFGLSLAPRALAQDDTRVYKTAAFDLTPFVAGGALAQTLKEAIRKKQEKRILLRDLVFAIDAQSPPEALSTFGTLVCFVEPNSSTPAYLYQILKRAEQKTGALHLALAIVGESMIERAATAFEKIRSELTGLTELKSEISFLGHASFDSEKLAFVQTTGIPYVQNFPQDTYHGQIKAIVREVSRLVEPVATSDFWESLVALTKKLAAVNDGASSARSR